MLVLVLFVGCSFLGLAAPAQPPYNGYYPQEESPYPPKEYSYERPAYHPQGRKYKQYDSLPPKPKVPACAKNTTATYCLEDSEYPTQAVLEAIYKYYKKFQPLYAEVSEQSTENSVEGLNTLEEETYLCPSRTVYGRPLRAKNVDGKWKIIVNVENYYQTTRLETCWKTGEPCPLVPTCYTSTCVQKSIYRRFVIYDENLKDVPFKIIVFKMPASCSCVVGAFSLPAAK